MKEYTVTKGQRGCGIEKSVICYTKENAIRLAKHLAKRKYHSCELDKFLVHKKLERVGICMWVQPEQYYEMGEYYVKIDGIDEEERIIEIDLSKTGACFMSSQDYGKKNINLCKKENGVVLIKVYELIGNNDILLINLEVIDMSLGIANMILNKYNLKIISM